MVQNEHTAIRWIYIHKVFGEKTILFRIALKINLDIHLSKKVKDWCTENCKSQTKETEERYPMFLILKN